MKALLLFLIVLPVTITAQTIVSVVGNGSLGFNGDGGPATAAELFPVAVAFDLSGNLYVADEFAIRKVSTSGTITTIAGNGTSGESGDGGPATAALIDHPSGIVVDASGNIFFTEIFKCRVRKISPMGIITTVAGNGTCGYSGDMGAASAAMINDPIGITLDVHDNLYFTDAYRIRKVSSMGIISTVAGIGSYGYSGDGGPATAAMLYEPHGVAVDVEGNIYIADQVNYRIRKVSSSGIISTIAGTGVDGYSGFGGPALAAELYPCDIVVDPYGNLFFSDYLTNICKISPSGIITNIAGNGSQGYIGDGGQASASELDHPYGITLDTCGNIFVADGNNNRVREIMFAKCHYLDVPDVASSSELSIYPNPTYDILNINNITSTSTYTLQSIVGATIQQGTLKEGNNSINIWAVPNGMYMLVISTLSTSVMVSSPNQGRGEVRKISKIVKQ